MPEIAEAGRELLRAYEFSKKEGQTVREDADLGRIAQVSLKGDEGIPVVRRIARNMMAAINRYDIYAHEHDDLMQSLLQVHPLVVLDEMFSGDVAAQRRAVQAFVDLINYQKSPLDVVADETLLDWCDRDPAARYPLIAASAALFKRPANDRPHEWTSLASQLLARAPDARAVLKELVQRLYPTSWSGSFASKLESRLKLFEQLPLGDRPGLAEAFNEAKASLTESIAMHRAREAEEDRKESGRFE